MAYTSRTPLEVAEVTGRRLVELTSRKYLDRALLNATNKAIDKLYPIASILPPFEDFRSIEPKVIEPSQWNEDFDTPWNFIARYTHFFESDTHYYDVMQFAGSCKDPFCDKECPLQLTTIGDNPHVKLTIQETSGPAICEITILCPLPTKIETHLRTKGIIATEHYSYKGSSGSNTAINCPTH